MWRSFSAHVAVARIHSRACNCASKNKYWAHELLAKTLQIHLTARFCLALIFCPHLPEPHFSRHASDPTLLAAPNFRFDLLHVMLDDVEADKDERLAQHIVDLARGRDRALVPPYKKQDLQLYVKYARAFRPRMTKMVRNVAVAKADAHCSF